MDVKIVQQIEKLRQDISKRFEYWKSTGVVLDAVDRHADADPSIAIATMGAIQRRLEQEAPPLGSESEIDREVRMDRDRIRRWVDRYFEAIEEVDLPTKIARLELIERIHDGSDVSSVGGIPEVEE